MEAQLKGTAPAPVAKSSRFSHWHLHWKDQQKMRMISGQVSGNPLLLQTNNIGLRGPYFYSFYTYGLFTWSVHHETDGLCEESILQVAFTCAWPERVYERTIHSCIPPHTHTCAMCEQALSFETSLPMPIHNCFIYIWFLVPEQIPLKKYAQSTLAFDWR